MQLAVIQKNFTIPSKITSLKQKTTTTLLQNKTPDTPKPATGWGEIKIQGLFAHCIAACMCAKREIVKKSKGREICSGSKPAPTKTCPRFP